MTIQEIRDYMASGKPVVGGGDVHMMFHQQTLAEQLEIIRALDALNRVRHLPDGEVALS